VKWNAGTSFPIGSGHGCIGCSEANFWDHGPLYERMADSVPLPGIDATPDQLGKTLAVLTGVGVTAHLASYWARRGAKRIAGKPVEQAENTTGEVK
jgi:hydrogenase small subunit